MTTIREARDAIRQFVDETKTVIEALKGEADRLNVTRRSILGEVSQRFLGRLAEVGADRQAMLDLDDRTGGLLGTNATMAGLQGTLSELEAKRSRMNETLDHLRRAFKVVQGDEREAEERLERARDDLGRIQDAMDGFEPDFLALREFGSRHSIWSRPKKRLQSPPLWAYLFDTRLVSASRMAKALKAKTGHSYHELLDEYVALQQDMNRARAEVALATDRYSASSEEMSRVTNEGHEAAVDFRKLEREIDKVRRTIDDSHEAFLKVAEKRVSEIIREYDQLFRAMRKPGDSPGLDILVKAGLLTRDDLAEIARYACLGVMEDDIRKRYVAQNTALASLSPLLSKLDRAVRNGGGSKGFTGDLDRIDGLVRGGQRVDDALRRASATARTETRSPLTVDNGASDMYAIHVAAIWMMLSAHSHEETMYGMPADVSADPMPEVPSFDTGTVLRGMGGLDLDIGNLDRLGSDLGKVDVGSVSVPGHEPSTASSGSPSNDTSWNPPTTDNSTTYSSPSFGYGE